MARKMGVALQVTENTYATPLEHAILQQNRRCSTAAGGSLGASRVIDGCLKIGEQEQTRCEGCYCHKHPSENLIGEDADERYRDKDAEGIPCR